MSTVIDVHPADANRFGQYTEKILLVSHYCPTRAHAGGLRILDLYRLIRDHRPGVRLDLLTFYRPAVDWKLDDAHAIFDHVYLADQQQLTPATLKKLRTDQIDYDLIDLQFHESGCQVDAFRAIGKKILFTPMESMPRSALLSFRQNYFSLNLKQLRNNLNIFVRAYQELRIAAKVDQVVCVSESDAAFLRRLPFTSNVVGLDTGISNLEFSAPLGKNFQFVAPAQRRRSVLFVAYFGSATNIDSLRWYLDQVHPKILESVEDYVFTVVGRGDLTAFAQYQGNAVELVGEVADLGAYIEQAGIGIAPALSGSGFRGKINQYGVYGVPSVVTSIAHQGLAYTDGTDILIADQPEEFASKCIRLLTDHTLNEQMGTAAREMCLSAYSWQSKWPTVRQIYALSDEVGV